MTDVRHLFRHAYDFAFGLGQNCANAAYMSGWNLRMCSSPFDWLDGSGAGLKVCVDLICSDFEGFLDKASLVPVENKMGPVDDRNCDYYRDAKTGFFAMHEFPRGVPLDESYPKVMAKLRRRIERMYARVRESKRTIFVYWSRFESVPDGQLLELVARLRKKFEGSSLDLLVIENKKDASGIERATELADGVMRVVGKFFVDRPDNLVMGDEKLNGRVYGAIPKLWSLRLMGWKRNVQRAAIRTLTSFCPVRARRKELRKRLLLKYVGKETV